MNQLPHDMIGLYEQYFEFLRIRMPFSTLQLVVIKHFRVHISQLVPLGLNRLTIFELYSHSPDIIPFVNLFRVFYKVSKQGHWFFFEKKVGKGAGGKVFRETFSGLKRLKRRYFFLDRRAISDSMAWRHHDSDVNDLFFSKGDGELATTWDFPGFHPIFKDTEGNVVTMSEYLCFLFLFEASIEKGHALFDQNLVAQHTTPPLLVDQSILDTTDHQKERSSTSTQAKHSEPLLRFLYSWERLPPHAALERILGDQTILVNNIPRETGLSPPIVTKCIKSLLSLKLIKEVKHVRHSKGKYYTGAEFTPTADFTGGSWYVDGKLDTAFIDQLKEICYKILTKQLRVATS
uniref:DNA-directed RNA polymerase III subunit RPC6 n=1 Tax=Tanacetum cinerariifolium TaxID=118510 RepID=A0A6L2NVY9_TANCI|nr:DNA-directed RNA polymerase III subunit RPC6 [Tanacetum cinerariifolium]